MENKISDLRRRREQSKELEFRIQETADRRQQIGDRELSTRD